MGSRGSIWYGDVWEALHRLEIRDPEAIRRVAQSLGFVFSDNGSEGETGSKPKPGEDAAIAVPPRSHRREATHSDLPTERPDENLTARIPVLDPIRTNEPWESALKWSEVETLPPPENLDRKTHLPFRPLIPPVSAQPLLAALVATPSPRGPIDLGLLIDRIVRGKTVSEIPRKAWPSLFRGVRVLVDTHPAMEPFFKDQESLVDALRRSVGKDRVDVEWFEGSAWKACGKGSIAKWLPFRPPEPGTPVLVLGDFGIGEGGSVTNAEWLELAKLLGQRGSPCIALVPYPAGRWPDPLRSAIDMVFWDRRTRVGDLEFRVRP